MNDFLPIVTETPNELNFQVKPNNNDSLIKDEKNSKSFHEIFSAKNNDNSAPKTSLQKKNTENNTSKKHENSNNSAINKKNTKNSGNTNKTQANKTSANETNDKNITENDNAVTKETEKNISTQESKTANNVTENTSAATIDQQEKNTAENFSQQDENSQNVYVEIEIFYFEFYSVIETVNNNFINNNLNNSEFANFASNQNLLNNFSWINNFLQPASFNTNNNALNANDLNIFGDIFPQNLLSEDLENFNSTNVYQEFHFFYAMTYSVSSEETSQFNNLNSEALNISYDSNYFDLSQKLNNLLLMFDPATTSSNLFNAASLTDFNGSPLSNTNTDQALTSLTTEDANILNKSIMDLIQTVFAVMDNLSNNQNATTNFDLLNSNNIVSLDYSLSMQTITQNVYNPDNILNSQNNPQVFLNLIKDIISRSTDENTGSVDINLLNNNLSELKEKLANNELTFNTLKEMGYDIPKNLTNKNSIFDYFNINTLTGDQLNLDKIYPNKINDIFFAASATDKSGFLSGFLGNESFVTNNNLSGNYNLQWTFNSNTPFNLENSQNNSANTANTNQESLFTALQDEITTLFDNLNKGSNSTKNSMFKNNFFIQLNNNTDLQNFSNLFENLKNIDESNNNSQDNIFINNFFMNDSSVTSGVTDIPQTNDQTETKENKQLTKDTFFDFIRDKYLANLIPGHKKTTIYLNPPELGKVKVDITITKNNEISATFNVEHPEIKEIVEKSIEALKVSLEGKGYNITQMAVKQSEGNGEAGLFFNNFTQNEQNNGNNQNQGKNTPKSVDSIMTENQEVKPISQLNPNSINIII